jgi:4-hydroxy-tetrahydrodipicolinate reductase
MKIGLIGYGKMGKEIERIALLRNHEVVWKLDPLVATVESIDWKQADVAIDFSTPSSVLTNIRLCFEHNIPMIIGTTGWYLHLEEIKRDCIHGDHTLMVGSNFSIGVNIFFAVNQYLAGIMNNYPEYAAEIKEIHHVHKLDAPSGTAITLAQQIIEKLERKSLWVNQPTVMPEQLSIISERTDDVPGTHVITYSSEVDNIEIKHIAHHRKGFAIGAVMAAEWMKSKKGFFDVTDMFRW